VSRTHYRKLLENEYLGQWDLMDESGNCREVVVAIEKVEPYVPERKQRRKMPDGSYKDVPNKKLKITFVGKRKPWLSGPATHQVLRSLYGPYKEDWIGKRVTLYVDSTVMYGNEKTGGLRLRPEKPAVRVPTTTSALDNPVDNGKSEQLARARETAGIREPGED
jgi:hypothetical protein